MLQTLAKDDNYYQITLEPTEIFIPFSGKRDRTILLLKGRPLSDEGVKDFSRGLIKCRL